MTIAVDVIAMTSNTQVPYQCFLELAAYYLSKISFLVRVSYFFRVLLALVSSGQYPALQWLLQMQHTPRNDLWSEIVFEIIGFGTISVIRIPEVAE